MSESRTAPSFDALWDTFKAAESMAHLLRYGQQLRWRIAADDWELIRFRHFPGIPIASQDIDGTCRLFGLPVDVVEPGAWPQLVIVCDFRH